MLKGFTDYPISTQEFGRGPDEPRKLAPVRPVTIHGYDGDKIALVEVEGIEGRFGIKYGYLYSESGRCGEVPTIPLKELNKLPSRWPMPVWGAA